SSGRSFLGGLMPGAGRGSVPSAGTGGAWNNAGAAAPPPFPGQAAPPPYGAQPQARAGGGFLRSALATAAGVAGGALLFQGISSLFAHNPGPFGGGLLGGEAAAATPPAASPWGAPADPQLADQGGGLSHTSSADPGQDQSGGGGYSPDPQDGGYGA